MSSSYNIQHFSADGITTLPGNERREAWSGENGRKSLERNLPYCIYHAYVSGKHDVTHISFRLLTDSHVILTWVPIFKCPLYMQKKTRNLKTTHTVVPVRQGTTITFTDDDRIKWGMHESFRELRCMRPYKVRMAQRLDRSSSSNVSVTVEIAHNEYKSVWVPLALATKQMADFTSPVGRDDQITMIITDDDGILWGDYRRRAPDPMLARAVAAEEQRRVDEENNWNDLNEFWADC